MINEQLLHPRSIVVIGGSNDIQKPGGAVLRNLIEGGYKGELFVTNLKEPEVQGIRSCQDVADLPGADLAIIAIAAKFVPETVEILAKKKNTRAFIILSAGFSEESGEGKILEKKVVEVVNSVNGALIGPNCIGVLTPEYHGVFTKPIPRLDPKGCDFISGSGATACFIMEAGIPNGLTFSRVFSVGNSAQMGVEDVLKHLDESFDPETSSRVKLLYMETISKPEMLLRHASSLIRKGCRIAAVKAGSSEAGSRAASSHTGALASPDVAVDALFRKAGIVRCYGREDLISVASVFMHPPLKGKNIAIITHAGGPAVMLTDALSHGGLMVPPIRPEEAKDLLVQLNPGSSVANPIDFLATGTGEQLETIIHFVDERLDRIDGMAVIFGTPGLSDVFDVYRLLDRKMKETRKPVFSILPSVLTAKDEISEFISKGRVYFRDEVIFGEALSRVVHTPPPFTDNPVLPPVDLAIVNEVVGSSPDGYLDPVKVQQMLDAAGIPRAEETVAEDTGEVRAAIARYSFPLVMKVIGPVHKSDVGGVVLNVSKPEQAVSEFDRLMKIPGATGVLMQPMLTGQELFAGATRDPLFGHMILCGLGGIYIEVLKDVASALAPVGTEEAVDMIGRLKGYEIFRGVRGKTGISTGKFAEIIVRLSALLKAAPGITELDINPLLGDGDRVVAVDARIRIKH